MMNDRKHHPGYVKVINWLIALLGLWEFGDIAAIFVPGFGTVPVYVWNHIIVGLILMIIGVWAALSSNPGTTRRLDWIAAIVGLWLVVATFILRPPTPSAGLLNDLIVGGIVLLLSIWAVFTTR